MITTRPTEHYLHPLPHYSYTQTLSAWTLSSFISSISLNSDGGNARVLFVLSSCSVRVLTVKYFLKTNLSSILTFILDCVSSETTQSEQNVCEVPERDESSALDRSASKSIYYLLVHSVKPHEGETGHGWVEQSRAHQGWILDLVIRVNQILYVFPFGLHSLILRCQCTVSWLIKLVCLTVSVLKHWWLCVCVLRVGHHLLLTCLFVFYCRTRVSHSQARPQPPLPPTSSQTRKKEKKKTCIVALYSAHTL